MYHHRICIPYTPTHLIKNQTVRPCRGLVLVAYVAARYGAAPIPSVGQPHTNQRGHYNRHGRNHNGQPLHAGRFEWAPLRPRFAAGRGRRTVPLWAPRLTGWLARGLTDSLAWRWHGMCVRVRSLSVWDRTRTCIRPVTVKADEQILKRGEIKYTMTTI